MLKLVRALLLLVVAILLVEAVVGLLSGTTGLAEKAIIAGVALALIAALPRMWRLGAPTARTR
jgi:hypothetical protein